MKNLRLLFAAGGTGGHIFPALAVAERCRQLCPDAEIEFVGTRGRLEETVVPRAGYPLNYLWISGLQRDVSLQTFLLPVKIGTSFAQALRLLNRFKPHAVVCAGAYVSYPIGMMAAMRGIPLVLMESNALPGRVVRKLAPRATVVHVAFEAARSHLRGARVVVSGNPVRAVFSEAQDRNEARAHFGLSHDRPTLFAFGGSLGARSINATLDRIVERLLVEGVQVIWQTGTSYAGGEHREPGLYRSTFIHEMEKGYAAADLVLARAGATTIAELAVVGRPSILVPLPNAADDHQRMNAEAMERAGAARMLPDAELNARLHQMVIMLLSHKADLAAMAHNAAMLAVPNADDVIAHSVVELAARGR